MACIYFASFNPIEVPEDEAYAANAIWVNDKVLVAAGYPKVHEAVRRTGLEIIELDVSEFQKVDGGLSCLSLRFSRQPQN
jgi:dimethylargininase